MISASAYAVPALKEEKGHINMLDRKLARLRENIAELDQKREAGLRRHASYRDSVVKKLAFRLRGRADEFAARAQRGQEDYYQVLRGEQQAKEAERRLVMERDEALATRNGLEGVLAQRAEAQGRLDELHNGIFGGPTPGFPEEEELEQRVRGAHSMHQSARDKVDADARNVACLKNARGRMVAALDKIREALKGGQLASLSTEQRWLESANQELRSAQRIMLKAASSSQDVLSVPLANTRLELIGSGASDDPLSRMAFHGKIRYWRDEIEAVLVLLNKELDTARSGCRQSRMAMESELEALEAAREDLRTFRANIFESICPVTVGEPLPSYESS